MGSDTGGYVRLRLETHVSHYDDKTGVLRRVSELGFERAPSPVGRTLKMRRTSGPATGSGAPAPTAPVAPTAPAAVAATSAAAPPKTRPLPAGKVALGGLDRSEVTAFSLRARMDDDTSVDMNVEPDDEFGDEARRAFGGKWAGFAVRAAPAGTRFRLEADIQFKPCWPRKAKRPFQVVPVVMAFGTDRFEDHYLLALIVAQKTKELVDTSVTQPFQ
jgi:hypothetical protein